MSGRSTTIHDQQQTKLSMRLAAAVVIILIAVILVGCYNLHKKRKINEARKAELNTEIRTEEQRAKDIEEYREYTNNREYIEEGAREKLGLVYEGEVIFKEEE